MTVPPARQCSLPSCEREAVDPTQHGALCEECIPGGEDTPTDDATPGCVPDKTASNDPEPRDNPDSGSRDALEAFEVAIDFFADQLDRDIGAHTYDDGPETPREYFEDVRDWSPETVDQKRLGYAPANPRALRDHLLGHGFDVDMLLATGLFYEDERKGVHPHFRGRYVLPYFDREGRPVYAMSRSLDEDDGGHAADHHGDQKYTKAIKGKDYSEIDEPIFGAETLDKDTDRLLVAGGIADAISLHEAGYACISPVTTVRFKRRHEPEVGGLIDQYGIHRVYQLNDAERPTTDAEEGAEDAESIGDVLTIQQHGEGLRGAFGNVEFLEDAGVEPYLVDLPAGGHNLRKVDPDDFVKEGWASVETVLASAKPASEHQGYRDWNSRSQERAIAETPDYGDGGEGGQGRSAVFDLDITDVTGLRAGERYKENPLGHHGDSRDYYVVVEDGGDLYGYDHKYNVAYNGLTYLLCAAGERQASRPNGPLSDREVFVAWRHAKDKDLIPEDDPIPRAALQHVAREGSDWNGTLVEHDTSDGETFDGLPADVYDDALDVVRDEYGLDPGRDPVSGASFSLGGLADEAGEEAGPEPAMALPLQQLAALDPQERRRAAAKRGLSIPETKAVQDRVGNAIDEEMQREDVSVVEAPTGAGKSYHSSTTTWLAREDVTGGQPVVLLSDTREHRKQNAEKTEKYGGDHRQLRGRTEACACAAGEHDPKHAAEADEDLQPITVDGVPISRWFELQCEGKGMPFSVAHQYADKHNDQGVALPCGGDGCLAITQWEDVPRGDDGDPTVDVIHATHQFALVPSLRMNTNVLVDELPDFTVDIGEDGDLSHDRVHRMVSAYLKEIDAPVGTWEAFVGLAGAPPDSDAGQEADHLQSKIQSEAPGRGWYFEEDDAHTLAPALTKGLWFAFRSEADANGRRSAAVPHEPPRLDANASPDDGWNRNWVRVVVDEDNRVRKLWQAPDFSQARSVVGLDARPAMPRWQLNVGPEATKRTVLDTHERALWRFFEQGKTVVQVGDATRPYTSGEYFDPTQTKMVLDDLRDRHGDVAVITAGSVEAQHREILEDLGDGAPKTMHYGEEKSREDFKHEEAMLVNGCIDPGDGPVLDLLAALDADARPETTEDEDGAEVRAHGRGFEGPDADTAEAVLESVRATHVAQAVGRAGRDPESSDRATVYVRTDVAPPDLVDFEVPGVEWVYGQKQRDMVAHLREHPGVTARELAEAVDATKEHVRQTLTALQERGVVHGFEGAGDHGATAWRPSDGLGPLGEVETTKPDVWSTYTWQLAITPNHAPEPPTEDEASATQGVTTTSLASFGVPPPG